MLYYLILFVRIYEVNSSNIYIKLSKKIQKFKVS